MSPAQRRAFTLALTDADAEPGELGPTFLAARRVVAPTGVLSGEFRIQSEEWREQPIVGEKPDGETIRSIVRWPAKRPPVLSSLPKSANWSLQGDPTRLDRYTFAYHLAREEQAVRTVVMEAIRPGRVQ